MYKYYMVASFRWFHWFVPWMWYWRCRIFHTILASEDRRGGDAKGKGIADKFAFTHEVPAKWYLAKGKIIKQRSNHVGISRV